MANSKQTINITEARSMLRHPAKQVLYSSLFSHRLAKHLNQEDLARMVGVSCKTIQNIERNRTQPSILIALKLAHVLQTPVDRLFEIKYELPQAAEYPSLLNQRRRWLRRYL